MASRGGLAFSIAVMGAVEGFILSMPLGYASAASHAPKSEFWGLAILGSVMITGAATAAIAFIALLALVLNLYRDEREWRYRRLRTTLMIALGGTMICAFAIAKLENGIVITLCVNAALLLGGLAVSFSQPS